MLIIEKDEKYQYIVYRSDFGRDWVGKVLEDEGEVSFNRTFSFSEKDVKEVIRDDEYQEDALYRFWFAKKLDDYYKIPKRIINTEYDLYIYEEVSLDRKHFIASENISIFYYIFDLVKSDIYLGGPQGNFGITDLNRLVKQFPNTYEIRKYRRHRINRVLREFFEYEEDPTKSFNNYLNRKSKAPTKSAIQHEFYRYEAEKFVRIHNELSQMLKSESGYSELVWQSKILDIILLLYPKYIRVFKSVSIKDVYTDGRKELDFMLVDDRGHIDIIEIKKPHDIGLISTNKYRKNHVPLKDLSGAIMQAEKYIYCLNKWGIAGEKKLTDKYCDELPNSMCLKVVNPNSILILGRDNDLSKEQILDFEIIRRKYKNVVDIMTYDDLLRRLENIIYKFQKKEDTDKGTSTCPISKLVWTQ